MAAPKRIERIVVEYDDGTQEIHDAKNPIICIGEEKYNKLSLFYEKYSNIIVAIRDDKSINALCEL